MSGALSTPCPNCGEPVTTGDAFCEACGTPVPGVFAGPAGTWGPRRLPVRLLPLAR